MYIRAIIIFSLLLFEVPSLIGQESIGNPSKLDTLVLEDVTIRIMPFQKNFLEAAGGVFKVSPGEIREFSSFPSTDLFNLVPGVHMASGSFNTNRIVIRGIGSRTPYNSNRIRAYLDDIPLTSGDGISTLEDLDYSSMGSLEVLKGPASALYGSGLGGVIRINSVYPVHEGFQATLLGEYGSYSRQRYGLLSSYKKGKLAISGGITRSSSTGYRENSEYQRTSAFLNARLFGHKHTLALTLSLVDLFAEIPSSINASDFQNEPWKAGGAWGTIKGYEEYIKLLSGLSIESNLGHNLVNKVTLFSTLSDPYERRPFNTLDEQSFNLGIRESLEYRRKKVHIRTGLEYFSEWFNWKILETAVETHGSMLSDQGETRRYLNGFALAQWRPGAKIHLDAGLNLNFLTYTLSTNYHADSLDHSGFYSYRPVLSPRLGASYNHRAQIWTYAAIGHGFSAPSLEETLLPEGTINTSLRPESGWNFELGNRGNIYGERLSYDLTLYTIFLKDLLVTERVNEDVFTGINAGNVQNSGIEFYFKGSLRPESDKARLNATLSLGYTISNNRFREFVDEGVNYRGNHLPGVPLQEFNALFTGKFKDLQLRLHQLYTGVQWMDDANDQKYEAYPLTHLQLRWSSRFKAPELSLSIYGGIRNLFNIHHASMILPNAPSFGGTSPRYYYPGSPRQFYLGLSLQINRREP